MKVASDGQVPVGELLGEEDRPRSRWRAALRWRDWNLPLKLGAVTLIPIVIAVVLGAITLGNQIGRADQYDSQRQLADVGASTRALLDAVQRERTLTAAALTEGSGLDSEELRRVRDEVDRARAPLTEAVAAVGERLSAVRSGLDKQLGALTEIRERASGGQLGAVEAVDEYRAVTAALLEVDTAVAGGIRAEGLAATADAVHNLLVAREEVSVHQALVAHGIAFGLAPSEFNAVRTADVRRSDRLTEFSAAATEAQRALFDETVRGAAFDEYRRVVNAVLSSQDAGSEMLSSTGADEWAETGAAVFTAMGELADRLGDELTGGTGALADDAGTGVGMLAVALFVAFVLAALVVFLIARQLLRSLKVLRTTALEVAQHELPEAVQAIQEGHTDDTEINPVPVSTRDEIGEVARAFDAVHSEALRLAAEQAGMRAGYASVFVNLSRRSQSLVQRQLQLIERLERDEEDADQLATLFQLDHLATRMRRNNENLMVLSGAEPARRSGQPVSATDVLRAAVSEIEQYQRVVVRTPPSVSVVGYAAGDLIRLVAELLDNATAFSAPETQVTVAMRQLDDASLSIDILDKGIGMNEREIAEANERLSEASSIGLTTSRRMGLFVVGRLASRHGFGVELHGGKDIAGVRATVAVPAELVTDEQAPYPAPEPPVRENTEPAPREAGDSLADTAQGNPAPAGMLNTSGGPLPRRKPGGSAATRVTSPGGDGAAVPDQSDTEMTGTALFTPVTPAGWDDATSGRPSSPPRQGGRPADEAADPDGPGAESAEAGPAWPSEAQAAEHTRDDADRRGRDRATDVSSTSGELLSGSKLFEANSTAVSDWWSAAVTENSAGTPTEEQRRARKAAVENAETTPIFDEMVSAWFRKVTDAAGSVPPEESRDWKFAADQTFKAVQEVSQRQSPSEYTDAGLPRRRRGERLLPGSAAPDGGGEAEPTGERSRRPRDPAEVLGRLSSFQQGVTRGRRHRRGDSPDDGEGAHGTGSALPQRPRRIRPGAAPDEPDATETTDVVGSAGGLFTDASRPSTDSSGGVEGVEGAASVASSDTGAPEDGGTSWAFAVDERWRTVEEVSRAEPTSYTPAGLPRRRRGERLLPGSAAPEGQAEPRRRLPRDPADVRGRLASFQQGVRRGRHHTAGETDNADERLEGE
ncbi:nitrate- and nitrite sensing domain-containing protein [Saccharomonospora cyanea]|uniref:histidine kinase n=1 Tax=Saccharomonospora cyanea NA-134 TaxID=882082 RepID=H5XNS8_9PSEU|nr:nitrate- and nitrite sensing domain-containing protein [Saccharomonospora cyanea]EHR62135.1 signal transduction histidine kinase [Saccharomonospora cyanea NA-134]